MRDRLNALVAVGDDDPALASAPHQDRLVEPVGRWHEAASGEAGTDRGDRGAGNRRGLGQRQLSADPVPQRANRLGRPGRARWRPPRRHLALVCFLHQAWRDTLDQAVDMYGKLLDRNRQAGRNPPRRHAQGATPGRRPDRSSLPPARARCCSIPTSATTSCGPDCCQPCRRRSCARTERHAGLSQFAGPFLSRMKFVDEQGEGASPTLVGAEALDFAPAALQAG